MRIRPVAFIFALSLVLPCHEALAQKRITDIQGREVLIRPASVTPRRLTAKATVLHPRASAIVTVNAGPDVDAANNDYRRIQNALNAAASGDTIILSGTFDFSQPFAAVAWALGNDGIAATADDYEVLAPGVSNVTLTATSLGSATILGPGDLPSRNLEAFLVFDASLSGASQSWTISNLRILDFDLSIGMFAVGVSDYNNTTITNNFIRIPTDLNATVAPADVLQNIGVHFSFGTNQSITGNSFQVPGDGVSAGANTSVSVVMQSNTSGGNVYNGLNIANNVIHILNAQSANPQVTLGIWENGQAHTSNITVSNNSFLNDAIGNSPALNLERAFRVTSHSGASTTVTYNLNTVNGANIGFQWIPGSNFAGNQAVRLIDNTITNSDTGVLVQSNGIAHLETDVITGSGAGGGVHVVTGLLTASGANTNSVFRSVISGGSADGIVIDATAGAITDPMIQNDLSNNTGFGLNNQTAPAITAQTNYWGSNLTAAVAAEVNGNVLFDPWLASGTDVSATLGFQPFVYATTTTVGNTTTFAGTAAADTGSMLAGNPVTLTMDGDTGFVPLPQLLNVVIQLGASDDVFTLGQTGVPTTFDGGPGNDTLIGTNVAQTWNITGAGSGNIPGAASAFTNTEALRGGTAADSFVFGAAGSIAQTVDGSLGVDTLDNSAILGHSVTPAGLGTLDGFKGAATGIGGSFDNINLIAGAPADLAVTKIGPATATAGTVISYAITVTNNGPNPSINATLTDAVPAGTTFASLAAPGGWSCTTPAVNGTGTVTCTEGSAVIGSSIFTLNVNAPAAPAAVSNTATVTSSSTDPTPGNNSQTANTNVIFTADLSILKTATPTAPAGTNVTYNITVTNNGPSPATAVSLTDTLPANTTFVSEAQNTGPAFACANPSVGAAGTVTCTNASLASGASATFTIVVQVSGSAPAGPLSNTANVTTTTTDPTTPNTSTASTTITAGNADLSILKTATPTAPAGTNVTYNISVTNNGPSPATAVSLTDTLPANTTFVSEAQNSGPAFACTNPSVGAAGTVTCANASLASGASATFAIVIQVSGSVPSGPLSNTANVTTTSTDPTTPNTSTASTTITSGNADLSILKTATPTAPAGTNVTYNITVTNNGPSPATAVSVTDTLPANTTFVSEAQNTGPAFACTNPSVGAAGTVTCTNASLASGASATFTIVVNVSAAAPTGPLSNTANVTTTSTDPTTPNTSSASTTITAGNADLSITKNPLPPPYGTGGALTYTIAVANAGLAAAANVIVTDVLPAGTAFVSATPSQGSCSGTTTVTCTLGTLANGGSASIALTLTLPSTAGVVSNTASVATTSPDPNPANNSSTSTITVVTASSIPATSPMVLLLLGLALCLAGLFAQRLG